MGSVFRFFVLLWEVLVPATTGEFWMMVAGLSTVTVAWTAVKGLRSLGLTKKGMLTRAQRSARLMAQERMDQYAKEIIPRNYDLRMALTEAEVDVFVQDPAAVRFEDVDEEELVRAAKWLSDIPEDRLQECVQLLNDIESWAGYFMNGLADPEVAFGPCAAPFLQLVVQYYPLYIFLRSKDGAGDYPNTVRLFNAWREELERERRGETMAGLLKRLYELQGEQTAKHTVPPPIGTDLE